MVKLELHIFDPVLIAAPCVASLPAVHLQAAGLQQALLQHFHQDLHVRAVPAGFPAVAALEAAVHRLHQAAALCLRECPDKSRQRAATRGHCASTFIRGRAGILKRPRPKAFLYGSWLFDCYSSPSPPQPQPRSLLMPRHIWHRAPPTPRGTTVWYGMARQWKSLAFFPSSHTASTLLFQRQRRVSLTLNQQSTLCKTP